MAMESAERAPETGAKDQTDEREEPGPATPDGLSLGHHGSIVQISINVSFPFSTLVVPGARRAGGRLFELIRRTGSAREATQEHQEEAAA